MFFTMQKLELRNVSAAVEFSIESDRPAWNLAIPATRKSRILTLCFSLMETTLYV